MLRFHGLMVSSCLIGASHLARAQHSGQLTQNGWNSDGTRADGTGTNAAGVNLVSPILTSGPEAGWGNPAHDADIRHQIRFGAAAGTVPMGTHSGAVHLVIGPNGSGKS